MSHILNLVNASAFSGGRSATLQIPALATVVALFPDHGTYNAIPLGNAGINIDVTGVNVGVNAVAIAAGIADTAAAFDIDVVEEEDTYWAMSVVLVFISIFARAINFAHTAARNANAVTNFDDGVVDTLTESKSEAIGSASSLLALCLSLLVKKNSKIVTKEDNNLIKKMAGYSGTGISPSLIIRIVTKLVSVLKPGVAATFLGTNLESLPKVLKYRLTQAPVLSTISAMIAAFDSVPNIHFWRMVTNDNVKEINFLAVYRNGTLLEKLAYSDSAAVFGVTRIEFDKGPFTGLLVMTHIIGRESRGSLGECVNARLAYESNAMEAGRCEVLYKAFRAYVAGIGSDGIDFRTGKAVIPAPIVKRYNGSKRGGKSGYGSKGKRNLGLVKYRKESEEDSSSDEEE